ncbi:MAG TPA: amidohydrolase [Armatimonadetes bacterium]|nr:amidohydrolase [Armatimonadota bacterium]
MAASKKNTGARVMAAALQLTDQLVGWRRHIHRNPEPSMQEHQTAAYVVDELAALGLTEVRTGVGETGVTCLVRGAKGRKTVGLRADMDALEILEQTGAAYASEIPGLMHACGHDAHVACLLGAGAILAGMPDALPGNVKLVFQPGEEGSGGALKMIQDGCLQNPKVSAIACLHVAADAPSGYVATVRGVKNAQTDEINLTIHGVSSHAARPDNGVDAISIAAQVLIAIQQFIGRHTNALDRKLVTFGTIQGGTRRNVLSDSVTLVGTMRTLETPGREALLRFLQKDLRKIVSAMGGKLTVDIVEGYPPLVNDDGVVDQIEAAAKATVGAEKLLTGRKAGLGGEDFAYFGTVGAIPAAGFCLGTYDEQKGFTASLHTNRFDFDDTLCLPLGAACLAQTAIEMLGG